MKPLVEPGAPLTPDLVERFSRHLLLPEIGAVGQRRLAAARVLVIGAGGLGSPALTSLAAAGVGTLGIVDDDVVDVSNLHRQTIHAAALPGTAKVASAAAAVAVLNPAGTVRTHPDRLTADNALGIFRGYDLILDGSDNFPTRYLVSDACEALGLPCVWGSVLQFAGQVAVFWAGNGPVYRDVFPVPPPPGSVPSCGEAGVLGAVCAVIGSTMATEAVKLICGIGTPLLGELLDYDALTGSFRKVLVRPDPARPAVTQVRDLDDWCASPHVRQRGAAAIWRAAAGPDGVPAPKAAGASAVSASNAGSLDGVPTLTAAELEAQLAAEPGTVLLDVRERAELASGVLPTSRWIPLAEIVRGTGVAELAEAAGPELIVCYCATGIRSELAATALLAAGLPRVAHLTGGIAASLAEAGSAGIAVTSRR